jgi:tetratricopeptide (TPR) repeat protein
MRFRKLVPLILALALGAAVPAAGQAPSTMVVIKVRTPSGVPLSSQAFVRLTQHTRPGEITTTTRSGGEAIFHNIPVGTYGVIVSAPGFRDTREEIEVLTTGPIASFYVILRPEAPATDAPAESLVLAPKAQEKFDKALQAIREKDWKEAHKRLEEVLKLAPGHPDVHYLLGVVYKNLNDLGKAREHLEMATAINPRHRQAWLTMGEVLVRQQQYAPAITALENALVMEPNSWHAHALLASACYQEKRFEDARDYAQRGMELARGRSAELPLLLGQAFLALGDSEKAKGPLGIFVREYPQHPWAAKARRLLQEIERRGDPTNSVEAAFTPPSATQTNLLPVVTAPPDTRRTDWAPQDVDETKPALIPDAICLQAQVLEQAARRARSLVLSLERITATEQIEHAELSSGGSVRRAEERKFDYVVAFRPHPTLAFVMEEDRRGTVSIFDFASGMATRGLAAYALLFHPFYARDYEMTCAGLTEWNGQMAWLVNFRQKADRTNRFRVYNTFAGSFPVKLKGRAWIGANSYDVLRMETDLLEPIPEAQLQREHLAIDYAPVEFERGAQRLWLPARVEVFTHFKGRRLRFRHTFTDFLLFSVDVTQEQKTPELSKSPDPPR